MRNTGYGRYITSSSVEVLDNSNGAGIAGTEQVIANAGSVHTHPNLPFLDLMEMDPQERLTHGQQVISVPLLEESW